MKKILTFFLLLFITGTTVVSCKSHEKCPAYTKVEKNSKQNI